MKSAVFASLIVLTSGYIWTPSQKSGFIYNNGQSDAKVKVDAFLDLLCGDCRSLYKPLLELADPSTSNQVQLRVHTYPLCFHTYAFYAAKGAFVYESVTEQNAFDWFGAVYDIMDTFSNTRTFNETTESVLGRFADLGVILGADREEFYTRMVNYNQEHSQAVLAWKYGASRGVHSTPTIFINDVLFQTNQQLPGATELSAKITALLQE